MLKVFHFMGQPAPGYAKMKRAEDARKDARDTARREAAKRAVYASPHQPWTLGPVIVIVLSIVVLLWALFS